MAEHTIGEVARRVGIGVETVRFYEREGLVTACDADRDTTDCPILDAIAPEVRDA